MSDDSTSTPKDDEEFIAPIANPPTIRKRTIVDILIDRASEASSDLIRNEIIPGIKDLALDATHGLIDGVFGSSTRGGGRHGRRRSVTTRDVAARDANIKVDYRGASTAKKAVSKRTISEMARANHEFDEILFDSRFEAQDVIDRMRERLDKYGSVTVDNLYQMMGVDPTFKDSAWGWDSLDGAHVRRFRGSYVLDLPDPSPLS